MPNEHPALYSVGEVDRKLCSHFCKHLQDVKFNLEDAIISENHFNLPDSSSDNTAFSKKSVTLDQERIMVQRAKCPV